MEPTWHDGLSRKALVELVEGLLLAMDKAVPRLDAVAHHLSLIAAAGRGVRGAGRHQRPGGGHRRRAVRGQRPREAPRVGQQIDTPEKAH